MSRHFDADEVREAARGRWDQVLACLAPALEEALQRPGRHVACPVHASPDGFRVFRDVAETGGGICSTCGPAADGFAMLQWINDWRFDEAVNAAAAALGLEGSEAAGAPMVDTSRPPADPNAGQRSDEQDRKLREWMRQTWMDGMLLDDADAGVARQYLQSRGIPARVIRGLRNVRFHPAHRYRDRENGDLGRWPAIVVAVSDAQGAPVTLHRTFLAPDGSGKADLPTPKRVAPIPNGRRLTGGAGRIMAAPFGVLGICEGLETALAITSVTAMPVWPVMSNRLLEAFEPPEGVRMLHIWSDKDRGGAGQNSTDVLRGRLRDSGYAVTPVHVPGLEIPEDEKGVDWLDVLNHQGRMGFPNIRVAAAAMQQGDAA